jgi:hypothetical protein
MSAIRVRFKNTLDEEFELELENTNKKEIFSKHQQTLIKLRLGSAISSEKRELLHIEKKPKENKYIR